MKKINVIKFVPYFPPHKWWLESHVQERSKYYVKKWKWNITIVTFDVWQDYSDSKNKIIYNKQGNHIWYVSKDWYTVYCLPSFDIVSGFPFPKFNKTFFQIFWILKKIQLHVLQTHTRFFLSSFIWGLFAKKHKIKRFHIEHGSDYVKLSSKFKNKIAYIYDKILGKRVFNKADVLIWVSHACREFIQYTMNINKKVHVIYRWLDFLNEWEELIKTKVDDLQKRFSWKIIIWYVGRLYKRKNVESLILAYNSIYKTNEKIQLVIVGDWEDLERLKSIKNDGWIYFTWWVSKYEAINLQKQFDIHVHSSNPWWWLATTLLQAMALWLFIVATPYEWAKEVIKDWVNGVLLKSDTVKDLEKWIYKALKEFETKKLIYKVKNNDIIKQQINWDKNIDQYYDLFYKSIT